MEIVLLDEDRFDNYAINHPNYNYYQSTNYGKFMSKNGHNSYYLGMIDSSSKIKAATLIIVKNNHKDKRKMGYAPRGFLIDWNNDSLLKEFTELIKEFLNKRGFTYLKLDPKIVYKEHKYNGDELAGREDNSSFVHKLQSLGYIHMGFNNGNETNKLRWNTLIELNPDSSKIFNSLPIKTREKIFLSTEIGNKVYKADKTNMNTFYSLLNDPKPPIEYYLDYYELFNKNNGFEIYFTKLNPYDYVNKSKKLVEQEETKNSELNYKIQDLNVKDKNLILNEKLKSDEKLGNYKKNMQEAIKLFQEYPSGVVTSGVAVIKYGKSITFLASGINDKFEYQNPEYLLKWQLIDKFAKEGYQIIDHNGMIGNFNNSYDSILKRDLSNHIIEYVGEFDLVINKKSYYTGSKLNPILNWLNTPIK